MLQVPPFFANLISNIISFSALTNQLQYQYSKQVEDVVLNSYKAEVTNYVK